MSRAVALLFTLLLAGQLTAFEVVVDYSYDTQGFFDAAERRVAMEAVADRFSRILTSDLTAVAPVLTLDRPTTWRIGFDHPGEGGTYQVSTALSRNSDPVYDASGDEADEYGFEGLNANEWILYAGGRQLTSAGLGGTATGRNFTSVFDDLNGPMHRGVISNSPTESFNDLPAWGGAISFDVDRNWNFDLDRGAGSGEIDFYSIALHEVGHALGISNGWNQWREHVDLSNYSYSGENALAAYNLDNGTTLSSMSLTTGDFHWADGRYDSFIFPLGEPNLAGTVGDSLQDLLLEPIANFSFDTRRFELTNVDVASLVDVGWSVLEPVENPLDLDEDGEVSAADVDLACSRGSELQPYFDTLQSLSADLDFSGDVGFSDFLILSGNFGEAATYTTGDVTCNAYVGFDDFLELSGAFGMTYASAVRSVPEPASHGVIYFGLMVLLVVGRDCRD